MRRLTVAFAVILTAAATIGLSAQTATTGRNEIKIGVSFVHATEVDTGLTLGTSTGALIEYGRTLKGGWTLDFKYLHFTQEITGSRYYYFPANSIQATLHCLTAGVQYHFARHAAVDPFLGFGVNVLYSEPQGNYDSVYTGHFPDFIRTERGVEIGPALEAGVNLHLNSHVFFSFSAMFIRNDIKAQRIASTYHVGVIREVHMKMSPFVETIALGFTW